ncbi:unnamed protein product [Cuscuta campestris]|uniref:Uncharacterized protein n=1 Tax=Cuscuta campestris TaxID=132261 RepID=A0A484MDU3_9ASTE|nr:unnamed protein product [Cuscuta campestris]
MPPLPQTVQFNMTQNQAFAGQCPIRPCSRQQGTISPPPGFFVPNRPCSRQHGTLSPPPGFFVPSHPPGYNVPRDNNLQAQSVSHQFQNGFVNRSSGGRRWNVSQAGPHNIQSRTLFKRSGPVPQSVTAHRHGNSSSHVHNKPPFHRNPHRGSRLIDSHGWATPPITNTGSPGSFPTDLRYIPSNPMPSQSQQSEFLSYISSYPQSFSQSPNYANPVSSQPFLGRTYTDYLPSEFPMLFQQYVDSNSTGKAPPNTHASEPINGINNIENPLLPRSRQAIYNSIPEIDFQSNAAGKGSESSVQPLPVGSSCGDINQLYSSAPIVSQDASQNISSHQGCQVQSVDPDGTLNEPHNVGPAETSFFATEVNNQLAESPYGFDDWFCEDPTVPRVIEVSVPPAGMNEYSPDSTFVGSWSLF